MTERTPIKSRGCGMECAALAAACHGTALRSYDARMEEWVHRALARWPNVPALYGWLSLDRRGRWLIQGEPISRPQIVETINRNYAPDARGCWYFQNGPQRGYMRLAHAPLVLHAPAEGDALAAHTEAAVSKVSAAYLDEDGGLMFATDLGPGALADADLNWALQRIEAENAALDEDKLAAALALPSGSETALHLRLGGTRLRLQRLDFAQAPRVLGFVREPRPEGTG